MAIKDTFSDKDRLAQAIVGHVPFDGWGQGAFDAAVQDCGLEASHSSALCPRGAIDLAAEVHRHGDRELVAASKIEDLSGMRYSEKVAHLIWLRLLAAGDKEIVRSATSLFALPHHSAEGAALIWGTSDAIWSALGDTSRDFNWYSKRATLSLVYGSVVLFWLGDQSDGEATREFIKRRIANVMSFEKFKSDARASKVFGPLAAGFEKMTANVRAPSQNHRRDLPGLVEETPK